MVDRTPEEPPPVVIAVVGPPGVHHRDFFLLMDQVGKTTLIKSLVRRYSKHTLTQVAGPITVVSGTFID